MSGSVEDREAVLLLIVINFALDSESQCRFKVVDSFSDPHSTQNTTKVYSFEYVGQ